MKNRLKIMIALLLLCVIAVAYIFGGTEVFNLTYIKAQQQGLTQLYSEKPAYVIGIFFLGYVIATALSLPFATLLTLLAGGIFGFGAGLIIVSFASSIGATVAFLLSRFIFRDVIQKRYAESLAKINAGFEKEGLFYLFALRLSPLFPFFLVNLTMGVLPVSVRNFYLLSQIGMLPATAVYVYAGTELGQIKSLHDISSPSLLVAFTVLGLFPLITKKALAAFRK